MLQHAITQPARNKAAFQVISLAGYGLKPPNQAFSHSSWPAAQLRAPQRRLATPSGLRFKSIVTNLSANASSSVRLPRALRILWKLLCTGWAALAVWSGGSDVCDAPPLKPRRQRSRHPGFRDEIVLTHKQLGFNQKPVFRARLKRVSSGP